MNETILGNGWVAVIADAAKAALALAAAYVIASGVRVNRGAQVNRDWLVIAVGVFAIGLALGSRMFDRLGLPNFGVWGDLVTIGGMALVLIGLVGWRRLLGRMTK